MKRTAILLGLALILEGIYIVSGLPWERPVIGRSCVCLKETREFIHPRMITSFQIIPQGGRCRKREIIIQLKNQDFVCLNPDTIWLKLLVFHIEKRRRLTNENYFNVQRINI